MLRRPIFLRAGIDDGGAVEIDEPEPVREKPDVSHVVPPPLETPPRDEAIELFARRLDVFAGRADRLERAVEAFSPVRIAELPSRAEFIAIEDRVAVNRERGASLERRLAELIESAQRDADERTANQRSLAEVAKFKEMIEARGRDLADEVADLRTSFAALSESVVNAQDEQEARESSRAADVSRRLAGAYTIALVALLAASLMLVLVLTR